jgi:1-deoxy-D-xylulose-5-phosphate synthase
VLAVGKLVGAALDAADLLAAQGIDPAVFDVRVVSPPDPEMIDAALLHRVVVTVEDGFRHGGAGEFLLGALATAAHESGVATPTGRVLGIPRAFVAHGKPDDLLKELGLDGAGMAESVRRALEGSPEAVVAIPFATHQTGLPPIR